MRRVLVAAAWLVLGGVIGAWLHASFDDRAIDARPSSREGTSPDATRAFPKTAATTTRESESAPSASRIREEPRGEAGGEGDRVAGSTSRRKRAECELLVLDENGRTTEGADVRVYWHDDPRSFEERLTWSPTHRRFSLPIGPIQLVASRGPALRSEESRVLRLENEAPRTIVLTLQSNCELVGRLHFPESEMASGFEVFLFTMSQTDLPELAALVRSPDFRSGDRAAWSWVPAGATSFEFDRLEPGRRLLVVQRGELVAATRLLELEPGRNEVDVELPPIPAERLFELRVTDSQGRPIHDVQVELTYVEPNGNGGGSWGFDAGTTELLPDGTLRLCTTEFMERMLQNVGGGRTSLEVSAPNHATESTPVGPGQRRFEVVLREERRDPFVVELVGASSSPYRELFHAEIRRYRDDGGIGWGVHGQHVSPDGIVVFDRVRPGRSVLVVKVRAASLLPLVPILRREITIDAANARLVVDLPPVLELTVRVAGSWPDGVVRVVEQIADGADTHDRIDLKLPIGSDGRAIFRTLPARRFLVECGDATTSIDLDRSSEVALAPKHVDRAR